MIRNLLFDLDDTLLVNSMDSFVPAYFKDLATYLAPLVPPDKLIQAVKDGTAAMTHNENPQKTLEQVFFEVFYRETSSHQAELKERIDMFYRDVFPGLKRITQPVPEAVQVIQAAFEAGYAVSIATNPIFPRVAVLERLRWADLDASQYPFELIPGFEHFHFSKPNPSYYIEFVRKLNASPEECAMIGNDLQMDIQPALQAGLKAFHVTAESVTEDKAFLSGPIGTLLPLLADVRNV